MGRYAPFTGIAFVAAVVVGTLLSNTSPNAHASGVRVIAFYTQHRSSQQASDLVIGISFVLFLFFAASVYGYLRQAPNVQATALLGLGGALLFAFGFALFTGIDFSLAYASHTISPSAAQALNVLNNQLFIPLIVGCWTFGIANGLAIVRSGLLPAWLGWAVALFGILIATPGFFVGLIGLLIWTIVTSVLIYRRSAGPEAQRAAPAPAIA